MKFDDEFLKKILAAGHYIGADDIKKAEAYQKERGVSFLDYLAANGLVTDDIVGQAIAESLGVPYHDLNSNRPQAGEVFLIPENVAKKVRAVVAARTGARITIATDNPKDPHLRAAMEVIFPKQKIDIAFSLSKDIDDVFVYYQKSLEADFTEIVKNRPRATSEIVDRIIENALAQKVSDIHFEPRETETAVRYRVDGVLRDVGRIPRNFYENIVNFLKVRARLRIDEHSNSQDGAIRFFSEKYQTKVDLRLSIVPTLDGEKIAIRLLSSYVENLTLANLGLSENFREILAKSAKKPFGMILATGPTGSGKTTTLYALIGMLNTRQINITTIEDPVEYKISGVNQIQVNRQTDLTFARGLRAIARQDPNVILVGEIRDAETANIAVNAALTGHLLLSTFHANDCAAAIPRFVDMGVEPFLAASTLEMIVSQRLVRKICESCRESQKISKKEIRAYGPEAEKYFPANVHTLYRGKGCPACSGTGFSGRVAVFEFLGSSPELQDLIGKNPSTREIEALARAQGFKPMFADGIEKVKAGITTLDELVRVVKPQ